MWVGWGERDWRFAEWRSGTVAAARRWMDCPHPGLFPSYSSGSLTLRESS